MDLLLYHALDDVALLSTDLSDGLEVTMLNGEDVVIDLDPARINDESNVLVDDGLVDILASNGVIHAIDTMLAPASLSNNIVDILAAGDGPFSTLVAAATAAGLVDDLSGEGPFTIFGEYYMICRREIIPPQLSCLSSTIGLKTCSFYWDSSPNLLIRNPMMHLTNYLQELSIVCSFQRIWTNWSNFFFCMFSKAMFILPVSSQEKS
jgi:hypothetical protein